MNPTFNPFWLESMPVVGILRGFGGGAVEGIVPAAIRGGLRLLEITLNTPGALDLIRSATDLAGDRMNVGAGTVLNERDLERAVSAGATFIVTPVVNERVIRRCVDLKTPVFPGAFTPTEIQRAGDLGATMVKVFPADQLGVVSLRRIKACLPWIQLMPTGGVSLDTLREYAPVADGFGVGSPLFRADRIRALDWFWVEGQCRAFCQTVAKLKGLPGGLP